MEQLGYSYELSAEEHMSEIRKLEISFAPRCQWTRWYLSVRSTWDTGIKGYLHENDEFKIIKVKTGNGDSKGGVGWPWPLQIFGW